MTRRIRRAAWIACACMLLAQLVVAGPQAARQVRMKLGSGVVKLGDVGEVILEVDDARDASLVEVPEVDGLEFVAPRGPSLRQSQSIINGRIMSSRTLTWVIRFRPLREGDFTIGPLRVSVDGQEVVTRSLPLTVATDLDGERFGLIEFVELPERVYEGEVFTLRLRFGWDRQLSGINSADLRLPWWGNLSGLLEVPSEGPQVGGKPTVLSLNSDEQIEVLEVPAVDVGGKPYRTFELRRQFVATRPGTLEIPTSFLVFSEVESGGIFNSRQRTRSRYFVGAPPQSLEVRELPADGRPLDYSNAVGRFHVRATTDRWDVDAGDSIKLTLEWLGEGNLEFFERPDLARLDAFRGFRSYGVSRDAFLGDRRIVTYDIAPQSAELDRIPGVPLSVFDTETGEYTTITSDPIPIRVRPLEGARPLAELEGEAREYDIADIEPSSGPPVPDARLGTRRVLGTALLAPLLGLLARTLVRRRVDPDAASTRRRRRARRALARDLSRADSASAQARALYAFLGARSDELPAAWIGRDAETAARATGLDLETARGLEELQARLDAATYAGTDAPLGREELLATADRLVKGGL